MMKRCILALLTLPTAAALGEAQTVCPWLSAGTAATALRGDVNVTASVASATEGSCHFSRQGNGGQSIDILVGKSHTHACPSGSTVAPSLGSEAVQCHAARGQGLAAETIDGRIRDIYFVVTMTSDSAATKRDVSPHPTEQDLPPAIERVAEMVVGSLY